MTRPEITILMSVHNGRPYLSEAIRSILAQTFDDFEFIIVDDGSTDGSGEDLEQWESLDARIRLIRQENQGLPVALNRGLRDARGWFVARMDADDISLPERLEMQLNFMRRHPGTGVLGTGIARLDAWGNLSTETWPLPSSPGLTLWRTLFDSALAHPTVMFRRDVLERFGGYDESLRRAQDFELWMRLALHTRMQSLPEVLLHRRVNGQGKVRPPPEVDALLLQSMALFHSRVLGRAPNEEDVSFCRRIYGQPAQRETVRALLTRIRYLKDLYRGILVRSEDARADRLAIREDLHHKILKVAYEVQRSRPFLGQSLKAFSPERGRILLRYLRIGLHRDWKSDQV
ncbi:glycosyltransferase family 2 protein [Ectothiorhodospira mobilis]|uniref:glycosyltransferase family 2 protein n=1 Tax=Ectothiorhodospira mobilis TaxID=195064 RepID=UPI00190350C4|nr:glycosyltransferase [Ectothiorhodospira mobilis]MBK1692149.1 hypothetical protein [Ectothiorhodospira mobilis]